MEDKHRYDSSYPKHLPRQELKAKVHVDETIFENKGINVEDYDTKETIGAGSGSGSESGSGFSNRHHDNRNQSNEDDESKKMNKEMKIKKPEEESRPLPHQQVPQPRDFSTQALEQL